MKQEKVIEEIEYIVGELRRLWEAEDLASSISPTMQREIAGLNRRVLERLKSLHLLVMRSEGIHLSGSTPPKYTIEQLERHFIVLRDAAELTQARAAKIGGREESRTALMVAKWAHQAALALKNRVVEAGRWSPQYIQEHGLQHWL